jgi:hypothetical protein
VITFLVGASHEENLVIVVIDMSVSFEVKLLQVVQQTLDMVL